MEKDSFNRFTCVQLTFIVFTTIISISQVQSQSLRMLETPANVTGKLDESVTLNCKFNKPVTCSWLKNLKTIKIPSDTYSYVNGISFGAESDDCSIIIHKLSDLDFTQWRCGAYDEVIVADAYVTRQVRPSDPVIMFNQYEIKDLKLPNTEEAYNLVCICRNGNPSAQLHWIINSTRYNDSTIQSTKGSINIDGTQLWNSHITFNYDWKMLDNVNKIQCQSQHPTYKQPVIAYVDIKHNHAPKYVEVRIDGVSGNVTELGKGENIELCCISDGQPTPSYLWEEWSEIEQSWKLLNSSNNEQNVTIINVGRYRCKASNAINFYSPTVSANTINIHLKKVEETSTGLIIGIVVACVLVFTIIVLAVVYIKRKQKQNLPQKDGHVGGQDGRDPEAVDESTEKTALSEAVHEPQQNGQQQSTVDDKLNGKGSETSPVKVRI
ncbi:hypothetical protein CHUAL_009002 [Chamberlinius hualienensis]